MSELQANSSATGWRQIKGFFWTPWSITALVPLLVLAVDGANFVSFVTIAVSAFLGTLPYILFAVLLIAYLKAAGAEAEIARAFAGKENRMIVMAALFGGLAPFCSCEVIPFIAGLLAFGAPLSAVMAFWLSSPLIDPPTLLITAGALGWEFALGKAVVAVALGLFGGVVVKLISRTGAVRNPLREGGVSACGCGPNPFDGTPVWRIWQADERRKVFASEFLANGMFLVKWLALAYVLEAILIIYVPASSIAGIVGGEGPLPVVIGALVGMPAYLNSYVAPPLVAGLIEQGMSVGAGMSFMIAGAVSSVPAMAAVWSLVKPRVFALYLGLGVSGAIVSGLVFQMVV